MGNIRPRARECFHKKCGCYGSMMGGAVWENLTPGSIGIRVSEKTGMCVADRPVLMGHAAVCRVKDCVFSPLFACPERSEQTILVQDFFLDEADFAEEFQLEAQGAGRVLGGDVGKDGFAVGAAGLAAAFEGFEVGAVAVLHEGLDGGVYLLDEVEDPE